MRRRGGILFVSAAAEGRCWKCKTLPGYSGRARPPRCSNLVQTGKQICIFQLKVPPKNEVALYLTSADDAGVSKMKQF